MYKEELSKYMSENRFMKVASPTDIRKIDDAEEKLKVKFPDELKALLLEINGDELLLLSIEQILKYNLDTREQLSECYDDLEGMLFVAQNGCGDYYAYIIYDNQINTTQIVKWDHEINTKTIVADNLMILIKRYYNNEI